MQTERRRDDHGGRRCKRFTLVELLVVIAIIAILCSLTMPVLRDSLKKTTVASCLNSMRQIGMAMHLYTNDNSFNMPNHLANLSNNYSFLQWTGNFTHVFPQYADKSILHCPSFPHSVTTSSAFMSYAIIAGDNPMFRPASDPTNGYQRISIRRLGRYENLVEPLCPPKSSARVLAADVFFGWSGSPTIWLANYDKDYNVAHYGTGSSTVFEDGHARWGINPVGGLWTSFTEWKNLMGASGGGGPYWGYHWAGLPTVRLDMR